MTNTGSTMTKKSFSVRLTQIQLKKLDVLAKSEDRTISYMIRKIIDEAISKKSCKK